MDDVRSSIGRRQPCICGRRADQPTALPRGTLGVGRACSCCVSVAQAFSSRGAPSVSDCNSHTPHHDFHNSNSSSFAAHRYAKMLALELRSPPLSADLRLDLTAYMKDDLYFLSNCKSGLLQRASKIFILQLVRSSDRTTSVFIRPDTDPIARN